MDDKGLCPFLYAIEQYRLTTQEDSVPTPSASKCIGSTCAVWNEDSKACGLSRTGIQMDADITKGL